MTERVVLVQCTGSKRDEPAPARDLYDESQYFRKQREYAEVAADQWYIQSAKHGLLEPSEPISPYDVAAGDLDDPEAWAREIAASIVDRHDNPVVEILGGVDYADPLTPELEARGLEVVEPLRGQKIGERMASLGQMVNQPLGAFGHD